MPNTASYWERRASARMAEYHKGAEETIKAIQRAHASARGSLLYSMNAIFERYAKKYKLDPETAKAILQEHATQKVLDGWRDAVTRMPEGRAKQAMLARLNAPSVRYRITNLQALEGQATAVCKTLEDIEVQALRSRLIDTATDAYDRVEYDLQKGLGIGWETTGINKRALDGILRDRWSGKNFSERIHMRAEDLAKRTQELMISSFIGGDSKAQAAAKLSKEFDEDVVASMRLVTTEVTHAANAAELERYQQNGIKRFMFRAVVDLRTSQVCQDHDGIVYNVSDAKMGVNVPPLHPWCRSTTIQVLSMEWINTMERTVIDPVTGEYQRIPGNMSYTEWKQKLLMEHGEDKVAIAQKRQQEEAKEKREAKLRAAQRTVYVPGADD